jgi:nucleoside-diphosphate-sugar epimerase
LAELGGEDGLKTVFLTGGSGFVGGHTAEKFLADGWQVKALVRDPTRPGRLPAKAQVVVGSLLESEKYRDAMRGCDAVVHVAGAVKSLDREGYRRANARGAEAVATAAAGACPRAMFVLVSSQAAAGPAREGKPVTESDPPRPVSWYGQSKLEGEEAVARSFPGPWCAIRPCVVYGPGDPGLLEMFRVVEKGVAPILAGGHRRLQLIAVRDLARLLVAAAARPDLSGRRGFAAVDAVSMRELALQVASMRRPPARAVPVPALAIRAAGWVESFHQWLTRRPRPFSRDKAREMLQPDWLCDARPMMRALVGDSAVVGEGVSRLNGSATAGVSAVPVITVPVVPPWTPWREGLQETCRCYVAEQWLRPTRWTV